MTSKLKVKILSALVCEDVRKEENGKEIIIGIYTGNIVVSQVKERMQLTIWLYFLVDGEGSNDFEFRGFDPSEREIFKGTLTIATTAKNTISSTLPSFNVLVEKEGNLKVQYRRTGGRWSTIVDKKVNIRPPD